MTIISIFVMDGQNAALQKALRISQSESGCAYRDATVGPDFVETPAIRHDFIAFVDQQFAPGLIAIKADQGMDIVDQNHRVA